MTITVDPHAGMTQPLPQMVFSDAVLPRAAARLPEEMLRGAAIPEDCDPLAGGVLMLH